MFEMTQFNVFISKVKKGGSTTFLVPLQLLAGHVAGEYAQSGEDIGVVANVVRHHVGWEVRRVGGQPGGVPRIGARHRLPPEVQDPEHARSQRPAAAAFSPTPGGVQQGRGGNPPHRRHTKHVMLPAF